jgi:hypothetical protein
MQLGRVGIWTFQLDQQPAARAQEAAHELETLGYGAIWIPEAIGREAFTNAPRRQPPDRRRHRHRQRLGA